MQILRSLKFKTSKKGVPFGWIEVVITFHKKKKLPKFQNHLQNSVRVINIPNMGRYNYVDIRIRGPIYIIFCPSRPCLLSTPNPDLIPFKKVAKIIQMRNIKRYCNMRPHNLDSSFQGCVLHNGS